MPTAKRKGRACRLLVWAAAALTVVSQVTAAGAPDGVAAPASPAPADALVQQAANPPMAVLKHPAEQARAATGRADRAPGESAEVGKGLAVADGWPTTGRGREPAPDSRAGDRPEFPTAPTGPPRLG